MKNAIFSAGILVLSLTMSSCTNNQNDEAIDDSIENHDDHDHDDASESLKRNKGKKWKVNEEMIVHVRDMEKGLETFEASESKDYAELAFSLSGNIGNLTSSCTMTGESHDELHKWLLPFIQSVEKLEKSRDNVEEESSAYEEIKTAMVTFNEYFE